MGSEKTASTVETCRLIVVAHRAERHALIASLLADTDEQEFTTIPTTDATSTLQAILVDPHGTPDVIVIDTEHADSDMVPLLRGLRLPGEVLRCAVVAITTGQREVGRRVLRAGAHAVVGTPWLTRESLSHAIESARERWRIARELLTAQYALRASERRLRTLADTVPQLIWESQADGTVTYYNARRASYVPIGAYDGQIDWPALIHPDDVAQTREVFAAAIAAGEPYTREHRLNMADGSHRWHLARALPVIDDTGKRVWYGSSTDIHERKLIEEKLAVALQAAADAVRARDQLTAMVSHDLRGPLNTITLGLDSLTLQLASGKSSVEGTRHTLEAMTRQARQMGQMLDELLDVLQLQAGHSLALRTRPTDLVALVRRQVELTRRETPRHAIEIEAVDHLVGQWDGDQLGRVLANLLSNAVKYSPGGRQIIVAVEHQTSDQKTAAVVRVRDHGIGIPAADRSRLFGWFARADNAVRSAIPGLGIGLAGSRQIVEQHGGSLTVESVEGDGSTFTVTLPLA